MRKLSEVEQKMYLYAEMPPPQEIPEAETSGLIRGMLIVGITTCACIAVLAGIFELLKK